MPRTADGRYYPTEGWAEYKRLLLEHVPEKGRTDAAWVLDRCEALEANVSNYHGQWCYWGGVKRMPPNWLKMGPEMWASFRMFMENETAAEYAKLSSEATS